MAGRRRHTVCDVTTDAPSSFLSDVRFQDDDVVDLKEMGEPGTEVLHRHLYILCTLSLCSSCSQFTRQPVIGPLFPTLQMAPWPPWLRHWLLTKPLTLPTPWILIVQDSGGVSLVMLHAMWFRCTYRLNLFPTGV